MSAPRIAMVPADLRRAARESDAVAAACARQAAELRSCTLGTLDLGVVGTPVAATANHLIDRIASTVAADAERWGRIARALEATAVQHERIDEAVAVHVSRLAPLIVAVPVPKVGP